VSSDLSLSLADTHCHLNFDDFNPDRVEVIHRAHENGIKRILIPGVDIESSRSAIKYARQFPQVFAAVGVHPNSSAERPGNWLTLIKQLASEEKVVAIGEIGLDYYRNYSPKEDQHAVFSQQLELAAEIGLPVIIHNREASDDISQILINWVHLLEKSDAKLSHHPGVLHSFSAGIEMAESMRAQNFKIGITGPVTFTNADLLQSVVISSPIDSLLIETDAPYLAPQPCRGKRNEPANVRIVAEKIAELKQLSVEMVAKYTTESADQVFDWR
jgi:TatD DNase family protein